MVTIANLLDWQPSRLSSIADDLTQKRKDLTSLQDEITGARPPYTWTSGSADNARTEHTRLSHRLNDMVAEVSKVAAALDFAKIEVERARSRLQDALDFASREGFTVDRATGEVADPRTYEEGDLPARAGNAAQVASIAREIGDALDAADRADGDLAKDLGSAERGQVEGGDGSLWSASRQAPSPVEDMSPQEIARRYADDVAIDTIKAWIEASGSVAGFDIEGRAEGTYTVEADGEVKMNLHLEAGLGRQIDAGGAEVSVSGGGTTDLELEFDSPAEADAFLDGLREQVTDVGLTDLGNVPGTVASNVAGYVAQQDISSFKTGVYASASSEFDARWARGEGEARVDGYRDWVKDEYGVRFQVSADAALGEEDSGLSGSGELAAEAKLDGNGDPKEVTFSGKVSAQVANERLGIDVPSSSTGAGADIRVTMDEKNEHFGDFTEAMTSGDLDRAASLAMDEGYVATRQTSIEEIAHEDHGIDAGFAGEAEVEVGVNAESADRVWVRPANQSFVTELDTPALRAEMR